MSDVDHDALILEHYRKQAEAHHLTPASTMADETTRDLEISAILACLEHAVGASESDKRVLELGCGNGYLLQVVRERYPQLQLVGADYSPDMVSLAASRELAGCEIRREDARALTFASQSFDVVITERCLINLLEEQDQMTALGEVARVVAPGGFVILIEAFTDGLATLNKARDELGLPPNEVPYHNRWFEKETFVSALATHFRPVEAGAGSSLPPRNFLSTHYFASRVLYPAVTKREILYNTEFVKFFRFLPPHGEFAPIQLFFLEKVSARA